MEEIDGINDVDTDVEEIRSLGIKPSENSCFSFVLSIVSLYTLEIICDDDELDKILDLLFEIDALREEKKTIIQIIDELLSNLNDRKAGQILSFLSNLRRNDMLAVIEKVIMRFFAYSPKQRDKINHKLFINQILKEEHYSSDISLNSAEFFDLLIDEYRKYTEITDQFLEEEDENDNELLEIKYQYIIDYVQKSSKIAKLISNMFNRWSSFHGEFNTIKSTMEYSAFLRNVCTAYEEEVPLYVVLVGLVHSVSSFAMKAMELNSDNINIFESSQKILDIKKEYLDCRRGFSNLLDEEFNYKDCEKHFFEMYSFKKFEDLFLVFYKSVVNKKEEYELDNLISRDFIQFGEFWDGGDEIISYRYYSLFFEKLYDFIPSLIQLDNDILEQLYESAKQNDISLYEPNNEKLRKFFLNPFDYSRPWIELEYVDRNFETQSGENYIIINKDDLLHLGRLKVKVIVHNIYGIISITKETLKNEYTYSYWDDGIMLLDTAEGFCSTEWGEWIDDDTIELIITKHYVNSESCSFRMIISVEDYEDATAIIAMS